MLLNRTPKRGAPSPKGELAVVRNRGCRRGAQLSMEKDAKGRGCPSEGRIWPVKDGCARLRGKPALGANGGNGLRGKPTIID